MQDGFERFVRSAAPGLLRLAYVLSGDAHRAEDLTQVALLNTHRRWDRVLSSPEGYARKALINAHIDSERRRSSAERPSAMPSIEAVLPAMPDHAEAVAVRAELRVALDTLAPRSRAVLVLRYYADMSDDAIAEALGIRTSTVRSTAARALAALRSPTHHSSQEKP